MQAEALQNDISDKQQALTDLKNNLEQDYTLYKKLKKSSKKYYDMAVVAKEEAEKAKESTEKINALISEIERIKSDYLQMKEDFQSFIDKEMSKIKSATVRAEIEKDIKQNMSRFEMTAELDQYVASITKKTKSKDYSL